jgi:hypothetical protein
MPQTKSKGFLIDIPYAAILCFLHTQCRIQKVMGSRLTSLIQLSYPFYMRSAAYKSNELPICHTRFLRPKPDAHRMYAQDQVVIHTVRM